MNTQTKLQKASRIVLVAMNFLRGIYILLMLVMILSGMGFSIVALGGGKLPGSVSSMPLFLVGLVIFIALLAFHLEAVGAVRQILISVGEEYTPFTFANSGRLKHVATCMVTITFVGQLCIMAFRAAGSTYGATPPLGLDTLFGAFLVYAISLVFEHGATLQQQADETL